ITTTIFFVNIIDKWAKQFSTVGIDDFKGQVDYYFPDSFQGFYGETTISSGNFYLPFQKNVYFGKAIIKETVVFNMNNDDTECIFPKSIEKIYCQYVFDTYDIPEKYYTNHNFLLTLRKIVFPSSFTVDKINYKEYNKDYAIFPFRCGSFTKNAINKKSNSITIGDDTYYYYRKDNNNNNSIYDSEDENLGYYTEREQELINQRLNSENPMYIEISETFRDNDEALRFVFGWELLDEEFEWLKGKIKYI
ncbi:MAG: hypothetical protein K2K18_00660, partial [Malacoplasma sp.]|nr:hypothetical protein [Malacoplasma sp.]